MGRDNVKTKKRVLASILATTLISTTIAGFTPLPAFAQTQAEKNAFGTSLKPTSIINADFETKPTGGYPALNSRTGSGAGAGSIQVAQGTISGWLSTETNIELWGNAFAPGTTAANPTLVSASNFGGLTFYSKKDTGLYFSEINASVVGSALYQDIYTVPGTIYEWYFDHRGRNGTDTAQMLLGDPNRISPTADASSTSPTLFLNPDTGQYNTVDKTGLFFPPSAFAQTPASTYYQGTVINYPSPGVSVSGQGTSTLPFTPWNYTYMMTANPADGAFAPNPLTDPTVLTAPRGGSTPNQNTSGNIGISSNITKTLYPNDGITANWTPHKGFYTIPEGQNITRLEMYAVYSTYAAHTTGNTNAAMGNLVDNINFFPVAGPTQQTIYQHDQNPAYSTMSMGYELDDNNNPVVDQTTGMPTPLDTGDMTPGYVYVPEYEEGVNISASGNSGALYVGNIGMSPTYTFTGSGDDTNVTALPGLYAIPVNIYSSDPYVVYQTTYVQTNVGTVTNGVGSGNNYATWSFVETQTQDESTGPEDPNKPGWYLKLNPDLGIIPNPDPDPEKVAEAPYLAYVGKVTSNILVLPKHKVEGVIEGAVSGSADKSGLTVSCSYTYQYIDPNTGEPAYLVDHYGHYVDAEGNPSDDPVPDMRNGILTTQTFAGGGYSFDLPDASNVTITMYTMGNVFLAMPAPDPDGTNNTGQVDPDPYTITIDNLLDDSTGNDFISTHTVSGTICVAPNSDLDTVLESIGSVVHYTIDGGDNVQEAIVGSDGTYSIPGIVDGLDVVVYMTDPVEGYALAITPDTAKNPGDDSETGYTIAKIAADFTGNDFTYTGQYNVSGKITGLSATDLANITSVTYTINGGAPQEAPVVEGGIYSISDVPYGATVIIMSPGEKIGYTGPAHGDYSLAMTEDMFDKDFAYTPITPKVTFDVGVGTGNSTTAPQTLGYGDKATRPDTDPTPLIGQQFVGWYADSGLTTLFDFDQPVTADTTVYAKYTMIPYKVSYKYTDETVPDGAPAAPSGATNVTYGTTGIPVSSNPSLTGYTFSGWETTDIDPSPEPGTTFTMPDKDVTFTGSWTVNTFTISYSYTGTVPEGAPAEPGSSSADFGTTQTVDIATAAAEPPAGYTFSGWTTEDAMVSGDSFTMPNKDVLFIGSWQPNPTTQYTVEHFYVDLDGNIVDENGKIEAEPAPPVAIENLTGTTNTTADATHKIGLTGFTYVPKYDDENGNYEVASGTIAGDGSLVLRLYYQIKTNSITYSYTGTIPAGAPSLTGNNESDVPFGTDKNVATKPTLAGYTFSEWETGDVSVEDGSFTMPDKTVTFTGSWTATTQTVSYSGNGSTGGTAPASQEVDTDAGYTVSGPAGLEKDGYTFAGWSTDPNATEPDVSEGDAKTMGAEDVTYYAVWTANLNSISYSYDDSIHQIPDGAPSAPAGNTSVPYGTAMAVEALPVLTGYTFHGWTPSGVTPDEDGNFTMPDGAVTFTGYWTVNTYTISYSYDDSIHQIPDEAPALPADDTVDFGSDQIVAPTPTLPGYTFSGWDVTAGGATPDGDGNFTMPAGNVTFTGSWIPGTGTAYTVEHFYVDLNGNLVDQDGVPSSSPVWSYPFYGTTEDTAIATPKDNLTGFEYVREYSDSNGHIEFASGTITGDGSLVLKLYYQIKTHSITYSYNGTVPSGAPATPSGAMNVVYNTAGIAVAADPTMTGYHFSGWSTSNASVSGGSFSMPDNDVAFTGSWMVNTYTVTYDPNGGVSGTLASEAVAYHANPTVPSAATPSRSGYTFAGWATSAANATAGTADFNAGYVMPAGNIVVYAVWNIIPAPLAAGPWTVTFSDGHGNTLSTQQVDNGGAAIAPTDPSRSGYTFAGWDKSFDKVTGNITITAIWIPSSRGHSTTPQTPPPAEPPTPQLPTPVVIPPSDPVTPTPTPAPAPITQTQPAPPVQPTQPAVQPPVTQAAPAEEQPLDAIVLGPLGIALHPGSQTGHAWSLLSCIMSIVALLTAILLLIFIHFRRRKYEKYEDKLEDQGLLTEARQEELDKLRKKGKTLKALAIIAGVLTPIVWLILDLPLIGMVWIDYSTPWTALVFIITMLLTIAFNLRKKNPDDEEAKHEELKPAFVNQGA